MNIMRIKLGLLATILSFGMFLIAVEPTKVKAADPTTESSSESDDFYVGIDDQGNAVTNFNTAGDQSINVVMSKGNQLVKWLYAFMLLPLTGAFIFFLARTGVSASNPQKRAVYLSATLWCVAITAVYGIFVTILGVAFNLFK